MAVIVSLTKSYTKSIYLDGTKKFTEILTDYVQPVKEYAATGKVNNTNNPADFTGYMDEQIQASLDSGKITQQEHDDTMAMKYPAKTE